MAISENFFEGLFLSDCERRLRDLCDQMVKEQAEDEKEKNGNYEVLVGSPKSKSKETRRKKRFTIQNKIIALAHDLDYFSKLVYGEEYLTQSIEEGE